LRSMWKGESSMPVLTLDSIDDRADGAMIAQMGRSGLVINPRPAYLSRRQTDSS
jgi:hypothetical protein